MLKSAAGVLGFLFALATIYYISFWGYFSIDVFQFISVGDIIKGIAYPLRFGGAWVVFAFLFIVLIALLALFSRAKATAETKKGALIVEPFDGAREMTYIMLAASVITAIIYCFFGSSTLLGTVFCVSLSLLLLVAYYTLDIMHSDLKEKSAKASIPFDREHPLVMFTNVLVVYSTIFLPINALVAGQVEARAIHAAKRYNYVLADDLKGAKVSTNQPCLIFLGAVSDKYIFIDGEESERFIVDKTGLPALKIHHYDATDKKSVIHQGICVRQQMSSLKQLPVPVPVPKPLPTPATIEMAADSVNKSGPTIYVGRKAKNGSS